MGKRSVTLIMCLLFSLCASGASYSQKSAGAGSEASAEKAKSRIWGVSGEVSAINKNFIAVVYRKDRERHSEEEIGLTIPKDVNIQNKNSLDDIQAGDIVEVQYEELSEKAVAGTTTKRVARVIRFVRAAQIAPQSSVLGTGAPEESVDTSGETDADTSAEWAGI